MKNSFICIIFIQPFHGFLIKQLLFFVGKKQILNLLVHKYDALISDATQNSYSDDKQPQTKTKGRKTGIGLVINKQLKTPAFNFFSLTLVKVIKLTLLRNLTLQGLTPAA